MKKMGIAALAAVLCWCGGALLAADSADPYAALKMLDGKWEVMFSEQKIPTQLENHCAKTGLFFACEQVVDGKTAALVVYLPGISTPTGAQEYKTRVLTPAAKGGCDWNRLTIEGDKWFYTWESTDDGKKTFWRNVNTFAGRDRIHFEIQHSPDGAQWTTEKQGNDIRKP
jgi:hypothetical protein